MSQSLLSASFPGWPCFAHEWYLSHPSPAPNPVSEYSRGTCFGTMLPCSHWSKLSINRLAFPPLTKKDLAI